MANNKSYTLSYNMINHDKYEYYPPHKNDNGSYICTCRYRLNRTEVVPLYFETPRLKTPSGIVKIEHDFYIDFEIPIGSSSTPSTFYEFLISNDEYNINQCHQNSKEWFGNHLPLHVIEKYYKSSIINRAGGVNPIWRIRIPSYKGKVISEIYNHQKELLDPSYVESGDELVCIVDFFGLLFQAKQFIPQYEIQKMKIYKLNRNNIISKGFIFSDDNHEDNENDKIDKYNICNTSLKINKEIEPKITSNIITNIYSDYINTFFTRNNMIMQPSNIMLCKISKQYDINNNKSTTNIDTNNTNIDTNDTSTTNIDTNNDIINTNLDTSTFKNDGNNENVESIDNIIDDSENENSVISNEYICESDDELYDLEMDDSDLLDLELVH